jgi:phage-related protein
MSWWRPTSEPLSGHAFDQAGYELWKPQRGETPDDWRPFSEAGPGVNGIRINSSDSWFGVMHVAKFDEAIYVPCSFQFQKSTRKTARSNIEIAKTRYRAVIALAATGLNPPSATQANPAKLFRLGVMSLA